MSRIVTGQSYSLTVIVRPVLGFVIGGWNVRIVNVAGPARKIILADRLSPSDARDNDGDGSGNSEDLDDDNDGVPYVQDADQDGDGISNADELAAGTDPNDRLSVPAGGGGDGGGGRCGATGLECLVVLGAVWIVRRRVRRR